VPYSDDRLSHSSGPATARVREVRLNEEEGIATVIVHDQHSHWPLARRARTPASRSPDWLAHRHPIGNESNEDEVVEEVWTRAASWWTKKWWSLKVSSRVNR